MRFGEYRGKLETAKIPRKQDMLQSLRDRNKFSIGVDYGSGDKARYTMFQSGPAGFEVTEAGAVIGDRLLPDGRIDVENVPGWVSLPGVDDAPDEGLRDPGERER